MKWRPLRLLLGVNLVALVVLAVALPHLMISPGKLIDAHTELTTDCFACHAPFTGSRPEKCIVCHEVAKIGLETTTGLAIADERKSVAFHQELVEEDCVACHSDHRGVQAFRPIGQFSHELLKADTGEHCAGCHRKPGDALHQRLRGECSTCHTQEGWTPATFDHDPYFRFDRHHTTDCATCHVDDIYTSYTCYGCHEHSRSKIREEHVEEGIYDYENCAECHRSGDEDEAKRPARGGSKSRPENGSPGAERSKSRHEDEDDRD